MFKNKYQNSNSYGIIIEFYILTNTALATIDHERTSGSTTIILKLF